MRNGVLAGVAMAFIGLGVATPAVAEDWRACVVGVCLKASCGNDGASVLVSMATNVDDPAVGGASGMQNALLQSLLQRGQPNSDPPMMQCTPTQPSQDAANQLSQNIFAQMKTSFYDVNLVSPNDLVPGYDSTPGSEDPRYNGGASSEATAAASTDDGAAQAAAQAEAAAAQRETEAAAERAAQEQRAATEAAAAAAVERQRVAEEAERARVRAEAEAKLQASTATDANSCVSSPTLKQNDTFEGNTAAYVVNGCGEKVDVRICLMRENGWNCGMTNGLAPQASWSWSSFKATGQVFMDARVTGSGRTLKSP